MEKLHFKIGLTICQWGENSSELLQGDGKMEKLCFLPFDFGKPYTQARI